MWVARAAVVVVSVAAVSLLSIAWAQGAVWADIETGSHGLLQTRSDEAGAAAARFTGTQSAGRLKQYVVRGTVTAMEGSEVSIESADGAGTTLVIADRTRLWVPGQPPTMTVELAVGTPILALGAPSTTSSGEKTWTARLVVVVSDQDLPKIWVRGRAVAITEQTIVVRTGHGERAIRVLPRTQVWSPDGRSESLNDIQPGQQVIALGQPTELGQWIAGLVLLPRAEPLASRVLHGQVVAMDANSRELTVETARRGEVTVVTSDETRYRIAGLENPDFSDVQVGAVVVAVGRFEEDIQTTFLAWGIGVLVPPAGKTRP
jgi:hypothetical protein